MMGLTAAILRTPVLRAICGGDVVFNYWNDYRFLSQSESMVHFLKWDLVAAPNGLPSNCSTRLVVLTLLCVI
jgi:hypothetical protein